MFSELFFCICFWHQIWNVFSHARFRVVNTIVKYEAVCNFYGKCLKGIYTTYMRGKHAYKGVCVSFCLKISEALKANNLYRSVLTTNRTFSVFWFSEHEKTKKKISQKIVKVMDEYMIGIYRKIYLYGGKLKTKTIAFLTIYI